MTSNSEAKLTKKQLKQGFWRSFTTSHAWHYERQQHMSFAYSMIPVINKLYPDKKDRIKGYERHLEFYNCQAVFHPLIFGITAAMEEENANNPDFDTSSINAMKVALMGPLAGVGDSLIFGTLRLIATGIAASFCKNGNPLGPILFLLIYNIPTFSIRFLGVKYGYELGNDLVTKISNSGIMNKLMLSMGIVGLMVIGSMIASTVTMATPITLGVGESAVKLQDSLDEIMPSLLPLLTTFLLYYLNKKQVNILFQIIGIMVIGILLGAIGILN
ncbi:PTS system mannose/fructose/sorbose family transporter subunit IID [Tetragenococcus koreensis]|uniref:PTS system mannose/fructose/sorbose family transporter subunit IID n=1 Tax=Tetragenococcus koreensis TaxID=290335 RepID=UPI000F51432F|nr:PTS system mannose/fructose/sorbose family transporter subunit IID [Tetragenococcus koreensis]AYW46083.1 PTS mannose transporter subunit IID [Tetragenococcus koreensis]GEN92173.1 PTS mannose transporter subunit IID [Tetragenococcus koreensis]